MPEPPRSWRFNILRLAEIKGMFRAIMWMLIIGLAFSAVLSLVPTPETVVERWQINVRDDAGKPINGCHIKQVWQDYSLESSDHSEELTTDKNGVANFKRRVIYASTLRRLLYPLFASRSFPHNANGKVALIFLWCDGYDEPDDLAILSSGRMRGNTVFFDATMKRKD
ncbi:MAG TPA: hypothetical protein VKX17_00080 [Planctomycetota bacterium]|nr:hypothetical protein [Planctomycetota bacterium]